MPPPLARVATQSARYWRRGCRDTAQEVKAREQALFTLISCVSAPPPPPLLVHNAISQVLETPWLSGHGVGGEGS